MTKFLEPAGKADIGRAEYILRELAADYENPDGNSSGILLHSNGKEHCTSFGDYFYMEALLRYGEGFEGYW